MKISIITAVLNSVDTIEESLDSLGRQSYPDIEHIVIDGGSTDGTLDILKSRREGIARLVSGPDRGIYDALNKGLALATGDVVGILHADDAFADGSVISIVAETMSGPGPDSCYGDLVFVDRGSGRARRYWKAGRFTPGKFERGWMPPHPTFFARKSVYSEYGGFDLDFPIAADYELMLRLLYKHRITTAYIPRTMVMMKTGGTSRPGVSTFRSIKENRLAWRKNGLGYPVLVLAKPVRKIIQWFRRPDGRRSRH